MFGYSKVMFEFEEENFRSDHVILGFSGGMFGSDMGILGRKGYITIKINIFFI